VGGATQRTRLLDAALALFARQSIAETTLGAIAKEAGVTPAMVHYYFRTRDQLLDVLIDERFVPLHMALGGAFEENLDDPVVAVTQLTRRSWILQPNTHGSLRYGCAKSSARAGYCGNVCTNDLATSIIGRRSNASGDGRRRGI
jgi:AcrR family transcriptional regulator